MLVFIGLYANIVIVIMFGVKGMSDKNIDNQSESNKLSSFNI